MQLKSGNVALERAALMHVCVEVAFVMHVKLAWPTLPPLLFRHDKPKYESLAGTWNAKQFLSVEPHEQSSSFPNWSLN